MTTTITYGDNGEILAVRGGACGIDHPARWRPAVTVRINTLSVAGDDLTDCMAHYLIALGYPTDRPAHLRRIAESMAARREGKRDEKRTQKRR